MKLNDLKYLSALTVPLSAVIGLYLKGSWLYITPIFIFVFVPILELILKENNTVFSESEKATRSIHPIFDWLLYLNLPIIYALLIWSLLEVSRYGFETYEFVGLALSVGIVLGGNGINVAHELGHRQASKVRFIGKALLLPSLYMHFYIEHNFGHHLNAATKEDPATARYKQSVYSFWITSTFRQYFSAWKIQMQLINTYKLSFLSLRNDMFWYTILQISYLIIVFTVFGKIALVFAILAAVTAFLLLETVNYIEHYGLLRTKKSSGRYERVSEIHSWNSNHVIGRILLYELTRHSDHHYRTTKKYQVLECLDESPQLPYGYPTSMVLTMFPPLWFAIMNKRVPREMISA
jgi:alkane 1-monooxygenase